MWGLERAHIVPLTVRDWWAREEFGRYTQAERFSQDAINSSENVIPLRSDMHTIEFLFDRFAWTIFSAGLLNPFLDRCVTSRRILVHDRNTGTSTVESRNPEQARGLLAASQSRSASPRKRKAPGAAGDHLSYLGYDPLYSDMEDDS
ncbi:hypothetical protein B0T18DRAFT_490156 [Schizothecium vesticola]|uniref:HNH nuclease domain-containing protein n=1 Tax=Schizothecium vesticola TaxID=314040 RepID=A0AA40EQ24_9PEZI|nr:hypothetical protein B0T18DRAFT_490156 [Schizothecium vesticola]